MEEKNIVVIEKKEEDDGVMYFVYIRGKLEDVIYSNGKEESEWVWSKRKKALFNIRRSSRNGRNSTSHTANNIGTL